MSLVNRVNEVLKRIKDPQSKASLYDLEVIENIEEARGTVTLTYRAQSRYCPSTIKNVTHIKKKLLELRDIDEVRIIVKGHVREAEITKLVNDLELT